MKKSISILLVLFVVLGLLFACGKKDDTNNNGKTNDNDVVDNNKTDDDDDLNLADYTYGEGWPTSFPSEIPKLEGKAEYITKSGEIDDALITIETNRKALREYAALLESKGFIASYDPLDIEDGDVYMAELVGEKYTVSVIFAEGTCVMVVSTN